MECGEIRANSSLAATAVSAPTKRRHQLPGGALLGEDLTVSAVDCPAGYGGNLGALDAKVAEFAIGHAVQFIDSLAILAPVDEAACDVHVHFLSVEFTGLNRCLVPHALYGCAVQQLQISFMHRTHAKYA